MPAPKRLEGRDGEIWQKVTVHRWTQQRVAAEYGISQQRVSQILEEVRARILADGGMDTAERMRQQSLELYSHLIAEALEVAGRPAPPMFVGKDGGIARDEDGSVVRDVGAKLAALQVAGKMEKEIRTLMGLDAASKAEVAATVKYEVIGVDTEDLQ